MAQGKKKRKINDIKTNNKKEQIKKIELSKEETTTNAAKKKEKEKVNTKTPMEKKKSSSTNKTTTSKKEEMQTTLPKEKKEPTQKEKQKSSETKKEKAKEIKTPVSKKKTTSKSKSSANSNKTTKENTKKTTPKTKKEVINPEKKEQKITTTKTKNDKSRIVTKKKKESEEQTKTKKKKANETKKKTNSTLKEKTNDKKEDVKKKSSFQKKKKEKENNKKKFKSKEVKKYLKEHLKEISKKEIETFIKKSTKNIATKFLIFLTFLAKGIKIGAIWIYNHAKIAAKKGKELCIRFGKILKVVFQKCKNFLYKIFKLTKKKWHFFKATQHTKREEKKRKKEQIKEEKRKLLEIQKQEIEQKEITEKEKNETQENIVSIEKKEKKKKSPIVYLIVFAIIGIIIVVLISLPYGTKVYKSGASGKILEVPKLSILKEECCNFSATFTSIRSANALQEELDKLITSYQKLECDNVVYYYNPEGDYTITNYTVTKGKIFNEFTITYGNGNSCDIDTTFKKLELLSPSFSLADAKKDGNYVIEQGKVYNAIAYDNFMKEVENKTPSTLRIVTTNNEGDVIITDLEYLSDGKFKVTHDKTRDRNSKEDYIMAYKFEHIGVYKNKLYAYNGAGMSDSLIKSSNSYYLFDV